MHCPIWTDDMGDNSGSSNWKMGGVYISQSPVSQLKILFSKLNIFSRSIDGKPIKVSSRSRVESPIYSPYSWGEGGEWSYTEMPIIHFANPPNANKLNAMIEKFHSFNFSFWKPIRIPQISRVNWTTVMVPIWFEYKCSISWRMSKSESKFIEGSHPPRPKLQKSIPPLNIFWQLIWFLSLRVFFVARYSFK